MGFAAVLKSSSPVGLLVDGGVPGKPSGLEHLHERLPALPSLTLHSEPH